MFRQSVLISACRRLVLCGLLIAFLPNFASAQAKPEEVVFHGSEKLPGSQPHLAEFYTSHFYVFFVPHRRGQGRSPGPYMQDLVEQVPPGARARRAVELHDEGVADVA